ncbi:hypothetical protein WJX84_000274 [Apatococcus fuscideae]|uniref:PHD-type domain-containing protein n=1 Tax=Apatococcus fuscideae TaxID=2026836 RepID=A0AAW1TDP3_9CHLO
MRGPHSGSGQKHEAVHLPRLQRHQRRPCPLEAAAVRVHQTRCVERQVLASALDAARQLPCRTPEEDSLEHILACFDHWQRNVGLALDAHAANLRLSVVALEQMAKSGVALEVACPHHLHRILAALRVERWRLRVEAVRRPSTKPHVDALLRLVKEGEAAGVVLEEDPVGALMAPEAAAGKAWQDAARDIMASLQDKADNPAFVAQCQGRVKALVCEAALLPVRVDRDLERIQEAARLYCLCRQPYNDKRPMLACDHCSEWFHYDCVGLLPPGEEEDDDAVAPKDFRCPACCLKAGLQYIPQHDLPPHSLAALYRLGAWMSGRHPP